MIKSIFKDIKNIFHIRDKKKFIIKNLPYLFLFYIGDIISKHINSYIDDNESSRLFYRSAYTQIISDAELGKIGIVIMKDMTRWGEIIFK